MKKKIIGVIVCVFILLSITACNKSKEGEFQSLDAVNNHIVELDKDHVYRNLGTREFYPNRYISTYLINENFIKLFFIEKVGDKDFKLVDRDLQISDLSQQTWGATEKNFAYGEWLFDVDNERAYQVMVLRKFNKDQELDLDADVPLKYYGLQKIDEEFYIAINPVETIQFNKQ